jgi:SpoVK/Ycf46/Vps4 family AAA+-type ATPase
LHTGQTIEVPFDVIPIFSTNLNPEDLADEAFLRRIRYKVEIPNPTEDEFRAIFDRVGREYGLYIEGPVVDHLLTRWYRSVGRELRGCHPRDLVEAVVDAAGYEGSRAAFSRETLDEACRTYFLGPIDETSGRQGGRP